MATTAPEVLDLLREKRCDYILGLLRGDNQGEKPVFSSRLSRYSLSRNRTLDALAEPWREQCRWRWKPDIDDCVGMRAVLMARWLCATGTASATAATRHHRPILDHGHLAP